MATMFQQIKRTASAPATVGPDGIGVRVLNRKIGDRSRIHMRFLERQQRNQSEENHRYRTLMDDDYDEDEENHTMDGAEILGDNFEGFGMGSFDSTLTGYEYDHEDDLENKRPNNNAENKDLFYSCGTANFHHENLLFDEEERLHTDGDSYDNSYNEESTIDNGESYCHNDDEELKHHRFYNNSSSSDGEKMFENGVDLMFSKENEEDDFIFRTGAAVDRLYSHIASFTTKTHRSIRRRRKGMKRRKKRKQSRKDRKSFQAVDEENAKIREGDEIHRSTTKSTRSTSTTRGSNTVDLTNSFSSEEGKRSSEGTFIQFVVNGNSDQGYQDCGIRDCCVNVNNTAEIMDSPLSTEEKESILDSSTKEKEALLGPRTEEMEPLRGVVVEFEATQKTVPACNSWGIRGCMDSDILPLASVAVSAVTPGCEVVCNELLKSADMGKDPSITAAVVNVVHEKFIPPLENDIVVHPKEDVTPRKNKLRFKFLSMWSSQPKSLDSEGSDVENDKNAHTSESSCKIWEQVGILATQCNCNKQSNSEDEKSLVHDLGEASSNRTLLEEHSVLVRSLEKEGPTTTDVVDEAQLLAETKNMANAVVKKGEPYALKKQGKSFLQIEQDRNLTGTTCSWDGEEDPNLVFTKGLYPQVYVLDDQVVGQKEDEDSIPASVIESLKRAEQLLHESLYGSLCSENTVTVGAVIASASRTEADESRDQYSEQLPTEQHFCGDTISTFEGTIDIEEEEAVEMTVEDVKHLTEVKGDERRLNGVTSIHRAMKKMKRSKKWKNRKSRARVTTIDPIPTVVIISNEKAEVEVCDDRRQTFFDSDQVEDDVTSSIIESASPPQSDTEVHGAVLKESILENHSKQLDKDETKNSSSFDPPSIFEVHDVMLNGNLLSSSQTEIKPLNECDDSMVILEVIKEVSFESLNMKEYDDDDGTTYAPALKLDASIPIRSTSLNSVSESCRKKTSSRQRRKHLFSRIRKSFKGKKKDSAQTPKASGKDIIDDERDCGIALV